MAHDMDAINERIKRETGVGRDSTGVVVLYCPDIGDNDSMMYWTWTAEERPDGGVGITMHAVFELTMLYAQHYVAMGDEAAYVTISSNDVEFDSVDEFLAFVDEHGIDNLAVASPGVFASEMQEAGLVGDIPADVEQRYQDEWAWYNLAQDGIDPGDATPAEISEDLYVSEDTAMDILLAYRQAYL